MQIFKDNNKEEQNAQTQNKVPRKLPSPEETKEEKLGKVEEKGYSSTKSEDFLSCEEAPYETDEEIKEIAL